MSTQVITEDDVVQMDLDDLKRTSMDFEVDPDELSFPTMAHHMTVRGKLEALVEHDAIDYDDMETVYSRWKESKQ